jgi:hypothetical protein
LTDTPDPLIGLVTGLTDALDNMAEQFTTLNKKQKQTDTTIKKTRHLTLGLVISVALDIILSIVLIIVANNQSTLSSAQRSALITSCQGGNVNKANDVKLWETVITSVHLNKAIPPAEFAAIQNLIHVRDHPINCVQRYGAK